MSSQPALIADPVPYLTHWRDLPHQRAALLEFWEKVPDDLKRRDAPHFQTWRADGKQATEREACNPLRVPYYSQRDSATEHALRMCFSSSCAMLLQGLKPGALAGANGDDAYLGRVLRYGDTTDAHSQIKALASFGVEATLTRCANWATVTKQIDQGVPVPMGILHHGPVSAPISGGHWICAIGYTDDALIVHDPFGDLDLIRGNYVNNWGARLRYSKANLGPRWMVEGPGTGWAIIASPTV